MPTAAAALLQLRTHPRTFLTNYYLLVNTGKGIAPGAQDFHFGPIDGEVGINVHDYMRTRQRRGLGKVNAKSFMFSPQDFYFHLDREQVRVSYLPVLESNDIVNWGNLNWLPLTDDPNEPDIAVTTLLNGCSISCRDGPQGLEIVHVQPTNGATSDQVRQNLRLQDYPVVFGSTVEYNHALQDITVVAVRRNNQWAVYTQFHVRNGRRVRGVQRIY